MTRYFARSTMGLYSDNVHNAAQIPGDAIVISEALYQSLAGQQIQVDGNGNPSPVPGPTAAQIGQANLKAQAQAALIASDVTASRCFKANVPFPTVWLTYVQALRAIVDNPASATALPSMPAYPAGT